MSMTKKSLKGVKKVEIGRFRTRVTIIEFILVMLPGSAIREKLLTQSLFIDTQTEGQIHTAHNTRPLSILILENGFLFNTDTNTHSLQKHTTHDSAPY